MASQKVIVLFESFMSEDTKTIQPAWPTLRICSIEAQPERVFCSCISDTDTDHSERWLPVILPV